MKLIKWLVVFAAAFMLAWILIFTFIQEPFRELAAARILSWWTPAFPIYLYVAGAFVIGFGVGLAVAFYNYVTLQSKLHHKEKECALLEDKVKDSEARILHLEQEAGVAAPFPVTAEVMEDIPEKTEEAQETGTKLDDGEDEL